MMHCMHGRFFLFSSPNGSQTISTHLGEDNLKRIINWVLKYMSDIEIPVKRWVMRKGSGNHADFVCGR